MIFGDEPCRTQALKKNVRGLQACISSDHIYWPTSHTAQELSCDFRQNFSWLILQRTRLVGNLFQKNDSADYYQTFRFSRRQKEENSNGLHPEGLTSSRSPKALGPAAAKTPTTRSVKHKGIQKLHNGKRFQ
ncbi:hypothetical protein AVEN_219913-1 [Araneus ventricosus]|uniref:Uncharacterized protein n=1 Tax=Araneus ventricosus TaxID=182803 RepID=A0A4Y2SC31_ARAVE|nr:hypothetical protein AVEN_113820-1 [Araneus ventricosus]GBN85466.1 hypothetical protein AVEN_219913-1 [Araneus ventricosus]